MYILVSVSNTCSSLQMFWWQSTFMAAISSLILGRSSPSCLLSIILTATFTYSLSFDYFAHHALILTFIPDKMWVASFTLANPPVPTVSCTSYRPSRMGCVFLDPSGIWKNEKYLKIKEKSQHGCVRWALREHLSPPCYDFACGGLGDCPLINETKIWIFLGR